MIATAVSQMETVTVADVTIDPERFIVRRGTRRITLTKTEFLILYLLMSTHGRIHARTDIARYVWGSESISHPRTIDTHISNIRKKIGPVKGREIITVIKGVGYKIDDHILDA